MKLRDIAYIINGTEKEFSVVYVKNKYGEKHITMLTWEGRSSYEVSGGELKKLASGVKIATPSKAQLSLNGSEVLPTMYLIDGNNYVKLRNIASILDFDIEFNSETGEVVVNTSVGYTKPAKGHESK